MESIHRITTITVPGGKGLTGVLGFVNPLSTHLGRIKQKIFFAKIKATAAKFKIKCSEKITD